METLQRRLKKRLRSAFHDVITGKDSLRNAAKRDHVPKSSLHDKFIRKLSGGESGMAVGPPPITKEEETSVLQMIKQYVDQWAILTRELLQDPLKLFNTKISATRINSLPFLDDHPSVKFVRKFDKINKYVLKFSVPLHQEGKFSLPSMLRKPFEGL